MQDLFFDKSPDLFYLLNHFKNEDIKVNVIKKIMTLCIINYPT